MIKTVIFDAFGTLFHVQSGASAKNIMKHITDCNIVIDEKKFLHEWKHYYKTLTATNAPFMTERDIFISRIQMFYNRYQIGRSAENDADALLAEAFARKAYPETKEVLEKLQTKFFIIIGSNTDNDVLDSVMKNNHISAHKVYTSENLKCYKPNPKFYQHILDDNGLLPHEVLFVGDSITDDVLGPKSIGIKTAWVDRSGCGGNNGQDYTVSNLYELLEILH